MRGGGWVWNTPSLKAALGLRYQMSQNYYGLKTYLDIAHNITHGIHSIVGDLGP